MSSAREAIVAAPLDDQAAVLGQPSKVASVNRALCKRAAGQHLTVFDRQLDSGQGESGVPIGFTPGAPANGGRRRGLGGPPSGVERPPQFKRLLNPC